MTDQDVRDEIAVVQRRDPKLLRNKPTVLQRVAGGLLIYMLLLVALAIFALGTRIAGDVVSLVWGLW